MRRIRDNKLFVNGRFHRLRNCFVCVLAYDGGMAVVDAYKRQRKYRMKRKTKKNRNTTEINLIAKKTKTNLFFYSQWDRKM